MSDGEDHQGEDIKLAEHAGEMDIIIHTLGIGTSAGGPIPILDEDGIRKSKAALTDHNISEDWKRRKMDDIIGVKRKIEINLLN